MKFKVVALVSCFLACGAAFAAPDVADVSLGMTAAQAKAAYKSSTKMVMADINSSAGVMQGILGYSETLLDGLPAEEFMAYQGELNGVWSLERIQRIPAAERYTKDALIAALRQKYGQESNAQYGERMAWYFDAQGKQYVDKDNSNPCGAGAALNAGRGRVYPPNVYYPGTISGPITNFYPACQIFYYAEWSRDERGMVKQLNLIVQNHGAMVNVLRARENAKKNEQQQQLNQQIQKNVKPSL